MRTSLSLGLLPLFFVAACSAGHTTADGSSDGNSSLDAARDVALDSGCPGETSACGATCANLQTDPHHCGSCATDCTTLSNVNPAAATCTGGHCDLTATNCAHGFAHCSTDPASGCESDLSQPSHCGACGVMCGSSMPNCTTDTSGTHCSSGCSGATPNRCGASCVDTQLDTQHCGTCSTVCPDPSNGHGTCTAGHCGLTCNTGFHLCAGDCVGDGDTTACGASCTPCPTPPHSVPTCTTGTCHFRCDTGFGDCDGNVANGCETDTRTNHDNCSACGMACPSTNTTSACVAGACTITMCAPGFADCNAMAGDGCETNTNTSPTNCGACAAPCVVSGGMASCVSGVCGVSACASGLADCDHVAANGCETNTNSDTMNCGACGQRCTIANGVGTCTAGTCEIASCNSGYADCDSNPANGCELHIDSDPLHCGGCANQCMALNGTAGCSAGMCTVASCNAGFADCDNMAANGCEVNSANDINNCGACGNNCNSACGGGSTGTACTAGRCSIVACASGTFDIDGSCANGCECRSSGTSAMCSGATMLGTLSPGLSTMYTGNLVPAGQEAYLAVFFTGNTSTVYHPHVRFSAGASEFAFDVLANCSGTLLACGVEGGSARSITDWETSYTAGDPASPNFSPIPAVGAGGTIIVHVYRRLGHPVTCSNYTLQVSG